MRHRRENGPGRPDLVRRDSRRLSSHEAIFGSSSAVQPLAVQPLGVAVTTPAPRRSNRLTCGDGCPVPLAGLEPAACCLGDVSVKTLCRSVKVLVSSERKLKVIVSSKLRYLSRYSARSPSAAIGHVHRTVDVRSQRAPHRVWPAVTGAVPSYGGPLHRTLAYPRRPTSFLAGMPLAAPSGEWSGRAEWFASRDYLMARSQS